MLIVPRNATNLITHARLVDANGDAVTGIAFDGAIVAEYRRLTDTSWQSITLVDGTLGTYLANSWKEISAGDYQFCPPNDVIVPGSATSIRITADGNPAVYGAINAASGDATEANQLSILASLSGPIQPIVPFDGSGRLILQHLDVYDDVARQKIRFPVTKDYTGASSVKLLIWVAGDPSQVLKNAAAVVESLTSIAVEMTASFSTVVPPLAFHGKELVAQHSFALVAEWPGDDPETIVSGNCNIYDRAVPA